MSGETRGDLGLLPRWKPNEDEDFHIATVAGVEVWVVNCPMVFRPRVALRGPDGDVVMVEYPVGLILAEAVRSAAIVQGAKP